MTTLPPLRPLFGRLAQLHPDWTCIHSPCYLPDGITEWAIDQATGRDLDWMRAHQRLLRHVISTIAGLGWSYNWEHGPGPLTARWASVSRGHLEDEGGRDEHWVSYGPPHRSWGLTDLEALLSALVMALEAHAAWEASEADMLRQARAAGLDVTEVGG